MFFSVRELPATRRIMWPVTCLGPGGRPGNQVAEAQGNLHGVEHQYLGLLRNEGVQFVIHHETHGSLHQAVRYGLVDSSPDAGIHRILFASKVLPGPPAQSARLTRLASAAVMSRKPNPGICG